MLDRLNGSFAAVELKFAVAGVSMSVLIAHSDASFSQFIERVLNELRCAGD